MKNFLKFFLPSALILAFGTLLALAQVSYRSVQLSQDLTGVFQVDANFGFYFPQHVLTTQSPAPTLACGSGSPSVTGTDFAGTVTTGTSTTSCAVIFASPYLATPYCVVTPQSVATITPFQYTLAAAVMTITQGSTSGNKFNYFCSGSK